MPGVHITAVEGVFTGHSNDDIRHNQRPPFTFLLFGVYLFAKTVNFTQITTT